MRNSTSYFVASVALALASLAFGQPLPQPPEFQSILEKTASTHADIPGVYATIRISGPASIWTGAAGTQPRESGQYSPSFRVASVSKLFVAVAVLRLWEQGYLRLEDPIARWLPPETAARLAKGGYDVHTITVRNLLAHTAGIRDAYDDYYRQVANAPSKHWTRDEQIDFAVARGAPLGAPGAAFAYSDLGYLLAGEVVERVSGLPLAAAVRSLDKFASVGLHATYFEGLEPPTTLNRTRQRIDHADVTNYDPSFDPYGASGVVSTTSDLALFVQSLFEGQVFDRRETLALAMEPTDVNKGSEMIPSTTLIFERFNAGGETCWGKSGWYSIFVSYCPDIRAAIAVTTTDATDAGWTASRDALRTLGAALLSSRLR